MKEEKYKINYDDYNLNIKFDFDHDKYLKEILSYKIKTSDEEMLDGIDIKVIEKYLRKKKLENIENK